MECKTHWRSSSQSHKTVQLSIRRLKPFGEIAFCHLTHGPSVYYISHLLGHATAAITVTGGWRRRRRRLRMLAHRPVHTMHRAERLKDCMTHQQWQSDTVHGESLRCVCPRSVLAVKAGLSRLVSVDVCALGATVRECMCIWYGSVLCMITCDDSKEHSLLYAGRLSLYHLWRVMEHATDHPMTWESCKNPRKVTSFSVANTNLR